MNEKASRRTCSICYKRIEPEGSWLEGHNAAPVIPHHRAHKSLVKHERCCAVCNFGIVLPIRIMQSQGLHKQVDDLLRPFRSAKNQSEVIVAHMNLFIALGAFGMNGGVN